MGEVMQCRARFCICLLMSLSMPLGSVGAFEYAADEEIETLVVTAQKRKENPQLVGMSVSLVDELLLEAAQVQTFADLENTSSSIRVVTTASPSQSGIFIRGVGTNMADPLMEPSVGVFVDGVYIPRSYFLLSNTHDVERVEILAGPQGTLYGKNTNAGAVSIKTVDPGEEFEFELEAGATEFNGSEFGVVISSPVFSDFGARFSMKSRRREGDLSGEYDARQYNEVDQVGYRSTIIWDPLGPVRAALKLGYGKSDANNSNPEILLAKQGVLSGVVKAMTEREENVDIDDGILSLSFAATNIVETENISFNFEHRVNDIDVSYTTGFVSSKLMSAADQDDSSLDILRTSERVLEEALSQEIQISNNDGLVNWVAGFNWYQGDVERGYKDKPYATVGDAFSGLAFDTVLAPLYAIYSPGSSVSWFSDHEVRSSALYGDWRYRLNDRLSMSFGGRYVREEKRFYLSVIPQLTQPGGDLFLRSVTAAQEGGDSFVDDSYLGSLGVTYNSGLGLLYSSVGTGIKSGGFNADFSVQDISDRRYKPEKTTSFELGWKSNESILTKYRASVSLFYTEFKDFQVSFFDPMKIAFLIENASKQVSRGVVANIGGSVTTNVKLWLDVQWLNAKYTDYSNAGCSIFSSAPKVSAGRCDFSGLNSAFAPELSAALTSEWRRPLSFGELYTQVNVKYVDEFMADPLYAPDSKVASHYDANVKVGGRSQHWDLSIWARNLINNNTPTAYSASPVDQFLGAALSNASSLTSQKRWVSDPRIFGASVKYIY